jgi:hypothetical protein
VSNISVFPCIFSRFSALRLSLPSSLLAVRRRGTAVTVRIVLATASRSPSGSLCSLSAPPSLVVITSALDDTLTLAAQALLYQCCRASHGSHGMMVLLVGADEPFMTWQACRNLPGCCTSLAFVFHSVCSESIFFKTMIH